jgi:O-antigen/teichoic acid export membrane protein
VRALFLVAVPLQLALFSLAPWLIAIVFTSRWTPALVPLYLLCIHWAGANVTSPLMSALNAIGRPRTALILSATWTVATLVLGIIFVRLIGYVGFALAYAVTMVFAAGASVVIVRRAIHIHLWHQVRVPLAVAVLVSMAGWVVVHSLSPSLPLLLVTGIAMGLVYLGVIWLAEGKRLRSDMGTLMGMGAAGR